LGGQTPPADRALVAAVCPGLVDTEASRPWFEDMIGARTPDQAAVALLRLALARAPDPRFYGELIQFDKVVPWR
jgi:carbonyl reductase 1